MNRDFWKTQIYLKILINRYITTLLNLLQLNLIHVELYFILIILQALTTSLYLYVSELESTFIEILN